MLQIKYQTYIKIKSPIKNLEEVAQLTDITNPSLNLQKHTKYKLKFPHTWEYENSRWEEIPTPQLTC
jgi:hypothetical protein